MSISSWSINNPIPVVLLFLLMTIVGLHSFQNMRIQNMPDVELPLVTVSVTQQGAASSYIESDIIRKLENSLATIQGVKHINASIRNGSATIFIEFHIEKTLQEGIDDVRDAVARVRADLPAEMEDPIIAKYDIAAFPVLAYTVQSASMDEQSLSWFVDNTVAKTLLSIKGIGAINRIGGATRHINVDIDPARLLALKVSAAEISRQLRFTQMEASAGRVESALQEQQGRMVATVDSAAELARMNILLSDGRHVRLDQIAFVKDTIADQRSAAFLNGKSVIAFEIARTKGGSEVDIMHAARERLTELQKKYPGIIISEAFNYVTPAIENYDASMQLLYEGALLAIIVVWYFLRNTRATLLAAVALPLSIIPTFAIMDMMGFTLNMVTLISLSLVVGVLVDDAIVEIENIMRHLGMSKNPVLAAKDAADEIGMAVIATTFTLIAVFLPTAFMPGIIGRFFVQFGWTAAIAVFFSLMVARMLTPLMAAHMLKLTPHTLDQARWELLFSRVSQWCMAHRLKTLVVAFGLFIAIITGLGPQLSTAFMPADDQAQTVVHLTLPSGSTFAHTAAHVKKAEALISSHPHVRSVYTAIGSDSNDNSLMAGEPHKARLTLALSPRNERNGLTKQNIEAQLRESLDTLTGVRVSVASGGNAEKYVFALSSDNERMLMSYAKQVMQDIRKMSGIGKVTSNADLLRSEIIIRPDFVRAAEMGVTNETIADTLRVATLGDYNQYLPKLNLGQRQVPVVVRLTKDVREDLALLSQLTIPGARGPVMLGNIATLHMGASVEQINRQDRQRAVTIEVELNGMALGEIESRIKKLPVMQRLPSGISPVRIGDAELMDELMSGFSITIGAGILCIYIVLVLLFKDFLQPLTILTALILSIPGAILSLFLTQMAFSMPAILGVIMLMGVTTKNAILLIEYAVRRMTDGQMSRIDALIDAGRKRTRPIVMTTIAMGGGMLPVALGMGADSTFRSPMAIVVIGGLITSTFLSLLVVPVVFLCIDDLRIWGGKLLKRGYQRFNK
ncbi:TPA: efflux RND transporter permease subunit [Klebsiella michiganensis]|nr:efflux RND transporter permease subunit [Klebsiella michiganensis]